jgi:hypothetical protein
MYEGILKQLEVFQDPVEVKTFLKETRQRRKVLIDIPYESIEEIPNVHGVLLINEQMLPALAWRLLKERDESMMIVSGDPQDIETLTIIYTFNRISEVGDIKDAARDALGDDIAKFQAVKINASFHILLEHHAHNKEHGFTNVPGTDYYVMTRRTNRN